MRRGGIFWVTMISVVLAFQACSVGAEKQKDGWLGVRLMPVPQMLTVHIGLKEGQGQMVVNVVSDSGADKAGIERYDVITAIDEKDVKDYEQLVEAIRSAGTGSRVKLNVISKGKRQNVEVKLSEEPQELKWRYSSPLEPGERESQQLRRSYKVEPFEGEELPFGLPDEFRRLFRKEFRFQYDPDKGETIIAPDEQTQEKLRELEDRLGTVEKQQTKILEKLDRLLEQKQ